MPYYPPGFTPAFGTVGAPSFAVGTTGVNVLSPGTTLQGVVAGVAVWAATAALFAITGTLNVNSGTITTSQPVAITQTPNASGVTFKGLTIAWADQAANAGSASGSLLIDALCGTAGTTSIFSVGKTGNVLMAGTLSVGTIGTVATGDNLLINGGTANGRIFLRGGGTTVATVQSVSMMFGSAMLFGWGDNTDPNPASLDTILKRRGAANINYGGADVASGAIAQSISAQGNTGATTTGPLFTINGAGGGSGAGSIGGELRLQGGLTAAAGTGGAVTIYTAPSGAGGTAALAMTWTAAGGTVVASGKTLTLGNAATTGLSAGVLAALTNATVVLLDSTGQAYRVPCII